MRRGKMRLALGWRSSSSAVMRMYCCFVLVRTARSRSTWQELEQQFSGVVFNVALAVAALKDPDGASGRGRPFGFRWFVPELLKHKTVWRDVLIASLLIQILALTTPLFTQVVIDKVLTDQTRSTLVVIAIGMGIFVIFTGILSWLRQYLVLHTGNRVDAVLGAAVFEHILKLPPRYFEARPTGVITARLRGVENIREFVASAAVTWFSICRSCWSSWRSCWRTA